MEESKVVIRALESLLPALQGASDLSKLEAVIAGAGMLKFLRDGGVALCFVSDATDNTAQQETIDRYLSLGI